MTERYPSEAFLTALSGQADGRQEVLFPAIGESPYYQSFYKMLHRLLDVSALSGQFRVYKDGSLTFGVRAGSVGDGAATLAFAGATGEALADNATNSIWLTAGGTLAVGAAGFPDPATTPHLPLARIVTANGDYALSDITDCRGHAAMRLAGAMTADQANELVAGGATALHSHTAGASQAYAVVRTASNGTVTGYTAGADTDEARGAALLAAIAASGAYDDIRLSPGTFAVGSNRILLKAHQTLRGCGPCATEINGTAPYSAGTIIRPADYSDVSDLAIRAALPAGTAQTPLGCSKDDPGCTGATAHRLRVTGWSDCVFMDRQYGTVYTPASLSLYDCDLASNYDTVALFGPGTARLYNTSLTVTTEFAAPDCRGINAQCAGARAEMFGGWIRASHATHAYAVRAAEGASVLVMGVCITSTAPTAYDLYSDSGSDIAISGCQYSPAKAGGAGTITAVINGTTATPADLSTLTGGSDAGSLHTHGAHVPYAGATADVNLGAHRDIATAQVAASTAIAGSIVVTAVGAAPTPDIRGTYDLTGFLDENSGNPVPKPVYTRRDGAYVCRWNSASGGMWIITPGLGNYSQAWLRFSASVAGAYSASTGAVGDVSIAVTAGTVKADEVQATAFKPSGVSPVADGTYTVGARITPGTGANGTITIKGGIITAVQQAT